MLIPSWTTVSNLSKHRELKRATRELSKELRKSELGTARYLRIRIARVYAEK